LAMYSESEVASAARASCGVGEAGVTVVAGGRPSGMTSASRPSNQPVGPATRTAEAVWIDTADHLVRGIAHELGSRSTVVRIAADPAVYDQDEVRELLVGASDRLQALAHALALLPRHGDAEPQPVQPADAAALAVGVHRLHSALGECAVEIHADPGTQPVLAVQPVLVHTLLVVLTAAKRDAQASAGAVVRVRCGGDAEWAWIRVEPCSSEAAVADVAAVRGWGARAGGAVAIEKGASGDAAGCVLRLRTLASARRAVGGTVADHRNVARRSPAVAR
jgi:hypothetical protein